MENHKTSSTNQNSFEYTIYCFDGTPLSFLLEKSHEVIYHFGEGRFDLVQTGCVDICMYEYDEDYDVTMYHRHVILKKIDQETNEAKEVIVNL